MKIDYKILIISILSLFIPIGLNAQIETKKKFFFDFRAGLNSSEMDIEDQNYGKKIKPGFHFAVVGSYKFQGNLQIQSGIHVTKKGLKQKNEERVGEPGDYVQVIESYTRTTDANYILVPLMLGWESDYRRLWIFNVNAGMYGAYGFSGETKERGTKTEYFGSASSTTSFSSKYDTFTSTNLKKFDYGLMGSVGVVYDIYTLNFGYEWGLANISNMQDRKLRNRNLTFSLGFRF